MKRCACGRKLANYRAKRCKMCISLAQAKQKTGGKIDSHYYRMLRADAGEMTDAELAQLDREIQRKVDAIRRTQGLPVGKVDLS